MTDILLILALCATCLLVIARLSRRAVEYANSGVQNFGLAVAAFGQCVGVALSLVTAIAHLLGAPT